jgi:hypothetical protein
MQPASVRHRIVPSGPALTRESSAASPGDAAASMALDSYGPLIDDSLWDAARKVPSTPRASVGRMKPRSKVQNPKVIKWSLTWEVE